MKTASEQQVLNPASNWIEVSAACDTCKSSKFNQAYNLLAHTSQAAALLLNKGEKAWTNPPITAFRWFTLGTSILFL